MNSIRPFQNLLGEAVTGFSEREDDQSRWEFANELAQKLGAQSLNICGFDSSDDSLLWVNSSMRSDWLEEYQAQGLAVHDPFLHAAKLRRAELTVAAGTIKDIDRTDYEINNRLKAAGYQHLRLFSTAVTTREYRITVLCSEDPYFDRVAPEMQILRRQICNVISMYISAPVDFGVSKLITDSYSPILSPRERDVLSFLAAGYRNDAIAFRLGLAEVTVRSHILSARQKLGAPTRENAIAIAFKRGLIDF